MRRNAGEGGHSGGLSVLAGLAVLVGVLLVVIGLHAQTSPPTVAASAAGVLPGQTASTAQPSQRTSPKSSPGASQAAPKSSSGTSRQRQAAQRVPGQPAHPLLPSKPLSISIPAIGVTSAVNPIGKAPDGTLAVPAGDTLDEAAWFKNSPTPGQPGPSVIEGHVDSVHGPSIFYRLAALAPHDTISVVRQDHTELTFTVTGVRDFPKSDFPTELVYGSDGAVPTLRLITCSDFDTSIEHHTGNTVVFAQLTHVGHRASSQHTEG